MLRKPLARAVGGVLVASTLLAGGPAQALPDEAAAPGPARAATLDCKGIVVGVTSDRHVTSYLVENGKVTNARTSGDTLGFDVTAAGYRSAESNARRSVLEMNAVAANGVPRRITATLPTGNDNIRLDSNRYDQSGFEPPLFADGHTYYAYTISSGGALFRWTLTKYADGDVRYASKVKLGTGYGKLTALQASATLKKNGVWREYLYATTEAGALKQIAVPLKQPRREKMRTLREAGYAGVTELSWSYCNDDPTHILLFAIDPEADSATWTTVKRSAGEARTNLRGVITGKSVSWDLAAAF